MQHATATTDGPAALVVHAAARAESRPASPHQREVSLGTVEAPLAAICSDWLRPLVVATALLACALCQWKSFGSSHVVLAIAAAITSRQIFTPLRGASARPIKMLVQWGVVAG